MDIDLISGFLLGMTCNDERLCLAIGIVIAITRKCSNALEVKII